MKNTKLRRIVSIVMATLVLAVSFSCVAFASGSFSYTDESSRVFVSNDYLEYCIDKTYGLYTIGTTGGNPDNSTDDNKFLLFEHGAGRTSYSTLVVDGNVFYPENMDYADSMVQSYDAATGAHTTIYKFGNIEMKQIVTIVDNNSTGRKDVVELKYVVTNNDTAKHKIGFRIMLDTMLANNDNAPFRVPGTGDVTTEKEYVGNNIPQYWQAFDNLTNPSIIAQGTFIRAGYTRPDKVQFTNWRKVYETPWNYTISPSSSNGDSAVSVIWNEKEFAAGAKETYVTYYGLSELQQVAKELSLSFYTDTTVDIVNGEYSPNPTVATAYIKNTSNYSVNDVVITINADWPLSADASSPETISIGTLEPGEEKQVSWKLNISHSIDDVEANVTATLSGNGVETLETTRSIFIPGVDLEGPSTDGDFIPGVDLEDPSTDGDVEMNLFQRIWCFIVKIFVFLGLS